MMMPAANEAVERYNEQLDWQTLEPITREQLSHYTGSDGGNIYVAIRGLVYDVSENRDKYGPEKPYHVFVGKDSTRLLGLNKLRLGNGAARYDACGRSADPGYPEHSTFYTDDFGEKEHNAVNKWEEYFRKRYPIVKVLVDATSNDR
ncbi:hypothetical protein DIURU_001656 [Diutina rugosa]|uniref:Cytochrome b5 heme-binding domain-containing protein n=1 Tax=Diutina rugosa TaxID=5481 RepID=A0A642V0A2_DIURU|nr:uncharacterized protein DIURU_001656 [Diutina rugosa]KAA8905228.1 hypothetical protein DIURU_001656 [Diutina rugosa]